MTDIDEIAEITVDDAAPEEEETPESLKEQAESDKRLLGELVSELGEVVGERGDNEGAVEVVKRLIRESRGQDSAQTTQSGMPKRTRHWVRITNKDKFIVFEGFVDDYLLLPQYPPEHSKKVVVVQAHEEVILIDDTAKTFYYLMPGDLLETESDPSLVYYEDPKAPEDDINDE